MDSRYFLAGFALYLLIMIGVSYLVSRRQSSSEDFLLAGRKVSGGLTFGTTVATMIGTGTSMGAVAFAYTHGWSGMLYGIGGAIGILLTAWWFAPLREMRFMTMSEELSYYVGANFWVKNGSAIVIFLASLGWLGAHIIGGALYLSWATGMDMLHAKLLIALAFTFYVMIGGYKAVIWTDSLMALLLFGGFLLMSYFSVEAVGGLEQLWHSVNVGQQSGQIQKMQVLPAISLSAVVAVGVLATPSFRQRIYSGRSVKSVRRSFLFAGVLYLLFAALPAMIGMSARILMPDLSNHQFAFTTVAIIVLPTALAVLVLLAGLSATLSSASSDSIAAVSILIRDLYHSVTGNMPGPDSAISYSRIAVLLVSVMALLLALTSNDLIRYITGMVATFMSGMFVIAVLGRFWLKLSWQGALAALLGAILTSVLILNSPSWLSYWGNPCLPALAVSFSLAIGVSLLSKAPAISRADALHLITAQREQQQAVHSAPQRSAKRNTPAGLSSQS